MKACNQCGKCCIAYSDGGLSATEEEIQWWAVFRPEIAEFVSAGKIWMDPLTGAQLSRCPWLQPLPNQAGYGCSIYADRPEDCRQYPVDIAQMVKDECEMLEPRDLVDHSKAQAQLDRLMVDSRPPGGYQ